MLSMPANYKPERRQDTLSSLGINEFWLLNPVIKINGLRVHTRAEFGGGGESGTGSAP